MSTSEVITSATTAGAPVMLADRGMSDQAGCLAYVHGCGDNPPLDNDGGVARPEAYRWSYVEDHPVTPDLFPDAAAWLAEERRLDVAEFDGARRWGTPLRPVDRADPLVISREPDGSVHIWDGNHRMAQAICEGVAALPMVVGETLKRRGV